MQNTNDFQDVTWMQGGLFIEVFWFSSASALS